MKASKKKKQKRQKKWVEMEEIGNSGSVGSSGAASEKSKYTNRFAIYKARRAGGGAALRFDFNPSREAVFIEFAAQRGDAEREFDWENKMVFKLAAADIGKILVVLDGKASAVDLFHDPAKSPGGVAAAGGARNAALGVAKTERGFSFKLSQQDATGGVRALTVNVSEDEAALLRILLARAIERIFAW
ncbi:MAG: hypothetical protein QW343_03655 [Candidatus Norongarragalinales archaeon]